MLVDDEDLPSRGWIDGPDSVQKLYRGKCEGRGDQRIDIETYYF